MVINKYTPNMRVFQQDLIDIHKEGQVEEQQGQSFSQVLRGELSKVNNKQIESENTVQGYIKGEKDIHEVMVATEEAKLSLELAIQIRNKLINVYEEFNKMQV
ncbi:flagellar hook-basal body complex protein FliE [Clostridium sp. UBA4548]|uniref:flagellar hook-basal body complex protein FliE n=1 Tax=Clostridium sp. UBA4548 TaxID=1946361 RepID=UPI0025B97CCC|nr:flagellar hook-basal body complex protein FliE [Clostridium sp. UBA4548]